VGRSDKASQSPLKKLYKEFLSITLNGEINPFIGENGIKNTLQISAGQ